MAEAGRGSIVNVSSIYGMLSPVQELYDFRRRGGEAFFKPVAYSVSKSALYNLTRYLATYWARSGVRVNTLTLAGVWNDQPTEFVDAYTERMPLGRMANVEEVVGPIVFLASDASSYVTGANLVADGGLPPYELDRIVGMRLRRSLRPDDNVELADLEAVSAAAEVHAQRA